MTPRVSVCVPAYQSAEHLQETLDSVWGQSFEDFELVVIDDGSADATPEILAAQADPRLRAFRHTTNVGQVVTVGETIARARAPLVKFLDSDDLLHADCLETMVAALDAHPEAAFAFSRREIFSENPDDPRVRHWAAELGDLPGNFDRIEEVNDGAALLRQFLAASLAGNWIAEPAGVMARRADLLAGGGYQRRLRQNNDIDLWARLMARGAVVFVDRPLYTYRLEFSGVTGGTRDNPVPHWLDPLWIAEGLTAQEGFPEPQALAAARRRLLRRAVRRVTQAPLRERSMARSRAADLAAYLRYRAAARLGRAEPLHLPIPVEAAAD
jgi:glycosyltransferase involved in cell wall biosynthesis